MQPKHTLVEQVKARKYSFCNPSMADYALDPALEALVGNLRASRERFRRTTEQELRQLQTDMAGFGGESPPASQAPPPPPLSTPYAAPVHATPKGSSRRAAAAAADTPTGSMRRGPEPAAVILTTPPSSRVEPLRERLRELKAHMQSDATADGAPVPAHHHLSNESSDALTRKVAVAERRISELRAELELVNEELRRQTAKRKEVEAKLKHERKQGVDTATKMAQLDEDCKAAIKRLRSSEAAHKETDAALSEARGVIRAHAERTAEVTMKLSFAQQVCRRPADPIIEFATHAPRAHRRRSAVPQAIADRDEQLAEQAATIKSLHQQLTRTARLTPLAASLAADVAAHRGGDSGFAPVADRPMGASKEREQRLASEVQALQAKISPARRPAAAAAPSPTAPRPAAAPPAAAQAVARSETATDRSPVRMPVRREEPPPPGGGETRSPGLPRSSSGRVRGEHASAALGGARGLPVEEATRGVEEGDDDDDDDAEASGGGEMRIEGKLDPSGVLRVSGGAAAAAAAAAGAVAATVRWWRVDGVQGAEWEVEPEEGEPLSYRCSAEDVGCVLRVECRGQVATTDGVVRPPKYHLQVLQSKYKEGSHDFKVRQADEGGGGGGAGGGKQLLLQLQADKVQLKSGSKTVDKAPYAGGGVAVRFEAGSELHFELQLGARRAPLRLEASNRQQRDMLLLALCSFSTRGWLEAALAGTPSPVVRTGTPRAGGGPEPSDAAGAQAVAEKPKKNSILLRGAAAMLGKGRRSTGKE